MVLRFPPPHTKLGINQHKMCRFHTLRYLSLNLTNFVPFLREMDRQTSYHPKLPRQTAVRNGGDHPMKNWLKDHHERNGATEYEEILLKFRYKKNLSESQEVLETVDYSFKRVVLNHVLLAQPFLLFVLQFLKPRPIGQGSFLARKYGINWISKLKQWVIICRWGDHIIYLYADVVLVVFELCSVEPWGSLRASEHL